MAFLNGGNGDSIFLEIGDEQKAKLFRPLADKPIAVWGHAIQQIETAAVLPTGQTQMVRTRDYMFHRCTSTNRAGVGCGLCNIQDPAWHQLPQPDQTNRKGQRVDFPRRPHYLLPVWSYSDNAVKVLRGGNQVYEEMDGWDTTGRDIRECDWKVWKTGQKKMTKYKTQRQDATAFSVNVDPEVAKKAMLEAMGDYNVLSLDDLQKRIQPISVDDAVKAFMQNQGNAAGLAAAPSQAQLPASVQGALQLPPAPAGLPAANPLANLSPEQIQALLNVVKAGSVPAVTAPVPLAQTATVNPVAATPGFKDINAVPTQPVQTVTQSSTAVPATSSPAAHRPAVVPNATEVMSVLGQAQVVAAQAASTVTSPSEYVIDTGKYQGKTVGELITLDPAYLKFYRAYVKDENVKNFITAALDKKPEVPVVPPAAAATTTDDKTTLISECRALIDGFQEFKGKGLGENLIPFLKSVIGRYDYNECSTTELLKLKEALTLRKNNKNV